MTRRTDRIANVLLAELARLLRQEVTDPRIGLVTLVRVDVAPDLTNAIVYYSTVDSVDGDALEALDEGLHSAAPFLRKRAARELPFKRMPAFTFRYDPSFSLGARTLDVLREISEEASEDATTGEGDER